MYECRKVNWTPNTMKSTLPWQIESGSLFIFFCLLPDPQGCHGVLPVRPGTDARGHGSASLGHVVFIIIIIIRGSAAERRGLAHESLRSFYVDDLNNSHWINGGKHLFLVENEDQGSKGGSKASCRGYAHLVQHQQQQEAQTLEHPDMCRTKVCLFLCVYSGVQMTMIDENKNNTKMISTAIDCSQINVRGLTYQKKMGCICIEKEKKNTSWSSIFFVFHNHEARSVYPDNQILYSFYCGHHRP